MGIISTEQLQAALEKSKSYADAAASASGLATKVVEEVPDVEDAEENVLYLVPYAGSAGMSVGDSGSKFFAYLNDLGQATLPYCINVYKKETIDGEECMAPLSAEGSMFEGTVTILASSLLKYVEEVEDLSGRLSDLEEQVSALTDSDAEEDSAEA